MWQLVGIYIALKARLSTSSSLIPCMKRTVEQMIHIIHGQLLNKIRLVSVGVRLNRRELDKCLICFTWTIAPP